MVISPLPGLSRREETWLACETKRCCQTAHVVPSGHDVWRIARTLESPAWAFLVYFRADAGHPEAFRLHPAAGAFRLLLAKAPPRRAGSAGTCIFLVRGRRGHQRCGLDAARPLVCQTFPTELVDGLVTLAPETGCRCRSWSLADVDLEEVRPLLGRRHQEAAVYRQAVATWNAALAAVPRVVTFPDYCDFLLAWYDALAERQAGEA